MLIYSFTFKKKRLLHTCCDFDCFMVCTLNQFPFNIILVFLVHSTSCLYVQISFLTFLYFHFLHILFFVTFRIFLDKKQYVLVKIKSNYYHSFPIYFMCSLCMSFCRRNSSLHYSRLTKRRACLLIEYATHLKIYFNNLIYFFHVVFIGILIYFKFMYQGNNDFIIKLQFRMNCTYPSNIYIYIFTNFIPEIFFPKILGAEIVQSSPFY